MTEQSNLVRNTASLFIAECFGALASFLLIIALSYLLGDEGLGKYSFILAYAGIFAIFYDFGIDTLLIREIAADRTKVGTYIPTMLSMRILLVILVILPAIISIQFKETDPIVILGVSIASLGVFCSYLSYFFRSLLQAFELLVIDAKIKFAENIFLLTMTLAGYYLYGFLGAIIGVGISQLCTLLISVVSARKYIKGWKPGFDAKLAAIIFKRSLPFWFTGTFLIIYFRIDSIMIQSLRNFSEVGLYNSAMKLVYGLHLIPNVFIRAAFPVMTRFYQQKSEHIELLLQQTLRYLLLLALPMAVGGALLSYQLMHLVYADEFLPAAPAFAILIISEAMFFLTYGLGNFLNSINKPKVWTYITGLSLVLNVLMNYFLIQAHGFTGAATATLLTQFLVLLSLIFAVSRAGYRSRIFSISAKIVLASAGMGLAVYSLPPLFVGFKIALGAAVYGCILLLLRGITKNDFDLIRGLLPKRS